MNLNNNKFKPGLYCVATPIGNMGDISFRAIKILQVSDLILCEDTRVTKKLIQKFEINKRLVSNHKFNENKNLEKVIEILKSNKIVSLVSDAGTPSISDPGFLLVRECIKQKIQVECLPGATAFVPALVNSGISCDRFVFEGFLPTRKGRNKRLNELVDEKRTMIFYESPHRILKTLDQFLIIFGPQRYIVVSREISKIYEENIRGRIDEVILYFSKGKIKGELVIIVSGKK